MGQGALPSGTGVGADVRVTIERRCGEVPGLVLLPAPSEDVKLGVIEIGSLDEPVQRCPLQLGEVFAGEEPDQIGRRVDQATVDALHDRIVGEAHDSSPVTRSASPRVSQKVLPEYCTGPHFPKRPRIGAGPVWPGRTTSP